jgi:hypothetical protein
MHQFVQSAIEAAKQGDNNKALAFIKQVLNANPNDVDAWLVLAAIVDDPQRKRQCLKRVLTLDPVNQVAREELLEMDRAEMGGAPPFTEDPLAQAPEKPAPVSKPKSQPKPIRMDSHPDEDLITKPAPHQATRVTLQEWPEETLKQTAQKPKPSSKGRTEKPQVFKYPLFWRILM